jgi:hypothetical protein
MSWQQSSDVLTPPLWLRVTRSGNSFSGYFSSNGVSWTQIGTGITISMGSTIVAGLAVCSRNNSALNVSTFDNVSVTGQWPYLPAAPTNLMALAGDGQVNLSWSSSVVADSYRVKRALVSGGPYTNIATNTITSFPDTTLTNGTAYHYVVSAVNGAGESADSPSASATPVSWQSPQLLPLIDGNQLQLSWPADQLGWRLEVQTNATGTGLGTNWVTLAGSAATNQMLIPMDAASGCVFFRLVYP